MFSLLFVRNIRMLSSGDLEKLLKHSMETTYTLPGWQDFCPWVFGCSLRIALNICVMPAFVWYAMIWAMVVFSRIGLWGRDHFPLNIILLFRCFFFFFLCSWNCWFLSDVQRDGLIFSFSTHLFVELLSIYLSLIFCL